MAFAGFLYQIISILAAIAVQLASTSDIASSDAKLGRSDFPYKFIFGASSSAYQFEGAAREGGRGPSMWDTFTHEHPEKIADRSNGDIAVDQYHRYKEDVELMKDLGLDSYRFSISWTRILPNGSLSGGINREGINYYNNLIDELISKGLKPFVTLFHWDSPQGLEDEYGGFRSPRIVGDFLDYVKVCFKAFGDRVKNWITINEPYIFCTTGYGNGISAPGRCSAGKGNCSAGDSSREPYTVGHHLLLAHAAAVELYKLKYQEIQKGEIGITLNSDWILPLTNTTSDRDAAQRALDFMFGWFMDPLTKGRYPYVMRALVGDRLPEFTKKQSEMVKGSFDFIGLNYYTSYYAYNIVLSNKVNASYDTDSRANLTGTRNGIPIGPKTADSYYTYPKGIRDLLVYTKTKYNDPIIYITENGAPESRNKTVSLKEALMDKFRVQFYKEHLSYVQKAIGDGVDVRGFFAWSLLDDFEWASGYTMAFGINYVDYKDNLKRYPKSSAIWYQKFLKS